MLTDDGPAWLVRREGTDSLVNVLSDLPRSTSRSPSND